MRRSPRALETRREVVDPPTRPPADSGDDFEKAVDERPQAVSCCAVAKTRSSLHMKLKRSQPSFGRGNIPSARPARKTSLFGRRPLEGRQRPKKPGPSLLQAASPVWRGAPVRLRLPAFQGRLTGLLSRSPPTDTRPQARAYWANDYLFESRLGARGFLGSSHEFFCQRSQIVGARSLRQGRSVGPAKFRR